MIDPKSPDYENTPASQRRPDYDYAPDDPAAQPFATIVTPFFNTGEVFHETARCVLRQSLQQWEWLIVNDGSTDAEALTVLDAYRDCDPRIRVIDMETTSGRAASRNVGFRAARAPYIVNVESDALLEPTAIEKWCWYLMSHREHSFVKGYAVHLGATPHLWTHGFHGGPGFLKNNLVNPTCAWRRDLLEEVGGFDESLRDGQEDWEYWMRCASHGHWGATIKEYLDWDRRRSTTTNHEPNVDTKGRQREFGAWLRKAYPSLWTGGFPQIVPPEPVPNETIPDEIPFENRLRKRKRRLLMITPWMSCGGADKFNLDMIEQLTELGWEVTLATTYNDDSSWGPWYARYTPDIFVLRTFLSAVDYPRFLRYLIQSRQIDVVLISHSELGYKLLPYLRPHFRDIPLIDYCHIEEPYWQNGGPPRFSVRYQELMDMNVVSSKHLKDWMVGEGADADRIRVCYTNVDSGKWRPDPEARTAVRRKLGIPESTPVILFVARVCPQKQPEVLAGTLKKLVDDGENFVALVAGGGVDFPWLQAYVKKHRLAPKVRLFGEVSNDVVHELMACADIFFLPSKWEGIALAIYEAMATGMAVVGADVGGQDELVTPECGVLHPRRDRDIEIARYAETLSELAASPERRRRLGLAARERVASKFQLRRMGERMIALMEEAIQQSATTPRPSPTLTVGRLSATEAVEWLRISQAAEWLWAERQGKTWGQRCYLTLSMLLEPTFQWGVRRGWTWLFPLAYRVKSVLLRH